MKDAQRLYTLHMTGVQNYATSRLPLSCVHMAQVQTALDKVKGNQGKRHNSYITYGMCSKFCYIWVTLSFAVHTKIPFLNRGNLDVLVTCAATFMLHPYMLHMLPHTCYSGSMCISLTW